MVPVLSSSAREVEMAIRDLDGQETKFLLLRRTFQIDLTTSLTVRVRHGKPAHFNGSFAWTVRYKAGTPHCDYEKLET